MTQDKGKLMHAHPANELTEKLFGFESVINKVKIVDAAAADLVIDSDAVPTGKIWKITYISAQNYDGDIPTRFYFSVVHNASDIIIYRKVSSTAQYETIDKHVELYLDAGDVIRAAFTGVASPETCCLNIFGYEMNAP
ncbi:MAG: hypothetical protein KJ587_20200 [Alphaproteobacteria bacterium]|nr:hypothetical protein [Alphaproteobacteria bacterium]